MWLRPHPTAVSLSGAVTNSVESYFVEVDIVAENGKRNAFATVVKRYI